MSNPLRSQLEECFAVVFPDVPKSALPSAAIGQTEQWDSLATLTLAAVIEESFGVSIEPDDVLSLVSFAATEEFLSTLRHRAAA